LYELDFIQFIVFVILICKVVVPKTFRNGTAAEVVVVVVVVAAAAAAVD